MVSPELPQIKVTVVTSCYNIERYIGLTLDSVLAQNFEDFTVIAVEDGSSDNTATILSEYADKINVLYHEDRGNHGQAASLNLALRDAESEYIAFIDGDDIWHPDILSKQAQILDNHADVGLVYTNGYVIDSDGENLYFILDTAHYETNTTGSILLNCYIRTPSLVMVRRSVLSEVGPFTVGKVAMDHDMWVRISEHTQFHFLNEMLVGYRQHPGQLSCRSKSKMWEDGFWVLAEAMKRFPYSSQIRRKRLAVIHYRIGECEVQVKSHIRAVRHFMLSFMYDPLRASSILLRLFL